MGSGKHENGGHHFPAVARKCVPAQAHLKIEKKTNRNYTSRRMIVNVWPNKSGQNKKGTFTILQPFFG
jgi:hypothetical protein